MEDLPHEFISAGLFKIRIEALTDGIYTIAMTLLVLGIDVLQSTLLPHVLDLGDKMTPYPK